MYIDQALARSRRSRMVFAHAGHVVLDAWSGIGENVRAGLLAAQGEINLASACAGGGWTALSEGNIAKALQAVQDNPSAPGAALLEAETLFHAGAVSMALERLKAMHHQGDPGASVALARHRHELGDHTGAMHAAATLPLHAHAAIIGARAAIAADEPKAALRFVEPLLHGVAPIPDAACAGSVAMVTATTLAKLHAYERLVKFVDRLLLSGDLPEQMLPTLARAAWTAGRPSEAWARCSSMKTPWAIGAKIELAILSGNLLSAQSMAREAGPVAEPCAPALRLLSGEIGPKAKGNDSQPPVWSADFGEGKTIHIWRTHPHRWQPWIEGALKSSARIRICNLAQGRMPPQDEIPDTVFDDGALIDTVRPIPVPMKAPAGEGVWVAKNLCTGIGPKHDLTEDGVRELTRTLPQAKDRESAAVRMTNTVQALACAHEGHPTIVIAPPGDPFWAGPIPETVWPAMRVVRSDPGSAWEDAADAVKAAVDALLQRHDAASP